MYGEEENAYEKFAIPKKAADDHGLPHCIGIGRGITV
jgi:hypothetical protein